MPVIFVFHKDIRYRLDAVHTGGMEVQRSCRGHVGMSASVNRGELSTCSPAHVHRVPPKSERMPPKSGRMEAESEQSESNVC